MKAFPALIIHCYLIFAGCRTVQKVAETQSAQIPSAPPEEPLGGNFLIKYLNPWLGAEENSELRFNEASEGLGIAALKS